MSETSFKDFVLDQLSALPRVSARAMFGGYGLYHGATFFGMLFRNRLYFKTNEQTAAAYRQHGMKPFRPNARQMLTSYYEVPVDVLEDPEMLLMWARQAIACQSSRHGRRRVMHA